MAMKCFKWRILDFPLNKFSKVHRIRNSNDIMGMRNSIMVWMMEAKTILSLKIMTSQILIN
jgi:hypothetical protein